MGEKLSLERYAARAQRVMSRAQGRAHRARHIHCTPLHVFRELIGEPIAAVDYPPSVDSTRPKMSAVLAWCEVELAKLPVDQFDEGSSLDKGTLDLLKRAEDLASPRKESVDVIDITKALLDLRPNLASVAGQSLEADHLASRYLAASAAPPPVKPTTEVVYSSEGRKKIRARARARGLMEDEDTHNARALRLIGVVESEIGSSVAVLKTLREVPERLVVTRPGRAVELHVEWRPEVRQIWITVRLPGGEPAEPQRYAWYEPAARMTRADGTGEFFDDVSEQLDRCFYSPGDAASSSSGG